MKKILYMISASLLILLASCQKEVIEEPDINFSPEKVVQVNLAAQDVTVTIESGDDWTLSGEYDWITPSARSGKAGDKVTFTLALNTSAKIRAAVFEVKTAKLTEKLVIKQIGTKIDMDMNLATVDYDTDFATVNLDMNADDLELFTTWGLRYVLVTSDTEIDPALEGEDIIIEGTPEKGSRDIHIENLSENNYYVIWCWLENADGVRLYSDVTTSVSTRPLAINYTIGEMFSREFKANVKVPMSIDELGLCWSETGNPDINGSHIGQTGIISSSIDLKSIETGELLKPATTYKVRPYLRKTNGEVFYGEIGEFTTKKDPFVGWFKKEGSSSNYRINNFNALSEYGPFHWGSKGKMNANPGTAQADITERLKNACDYVLKTPFQYIYLLFNELEDGRAAVKLSIYAGTSESGAQNKGSLIFLWNTDENGYQTFEYIGPASETDPVNDLMRFAEEDILYVIEYFNSHTFYFEFCNANIDNLTSQYSGIKIREVDNPTNGVYDFNIMNTINPSPITVHETLNKNINGFYVIKTPDHWKQFCELVNEEPSASAVLSKDIDLGDIQSYVGNYNVAWTGTFDGQGHTLTLNYKSSTAPFYYVSNATIRNLHTAGVIQTTGRSTSPFIAESRGSTRIERCSTSVMIWQTAQNGWTDNGGFAADFNGNLTIEDCVFAGSFKVESTGCEYGGFVGWRTGYLTIRNCLFAPLSIEGSNVHDDSGTFCSNGIDKLENCWYTQTLGSAQGSAATAEAYADGTLAAALNGDRGDEGPWTVKDGKTVLNF